MIATDILLFIFALGFVAGAVFALMIGRLVLPLHRKYPLTD